MLGVLKTAAGPLTTQDAAESEGDAAFPRVVPWRPGVPDRRGGDPCGPWRESRSRRAQQGAGASPEVPDAIGRPRQAEGILSDAGVRLRMAGEGPWRPSSSGPHPPRKRVHTLLVHEEFGPSSAEP